MIADFQKKLARILDDAVWAPSGDNSQPWYFHVGDDLLEVHMIANKDNEILNFRHSGTFVAIGALCENILISSTKEKMSASIHFVNTVDNSTVVARITFVEDGSMQTDPLADHMRTRCTNRKPYRKQGVPTDVQSTLKNSATDDVRVTLCTNKDAISLIGSASSTMERVALETEAIHKLFFQNIVWTSSEEKERGGGLYIKTTELPPPVQLLFRAIKHWPIARTLNQLGLSRLASFSNAQIYASSPLLVMLSIDTPSPDGYFAVGRSMQRMWLTATSVGLATQPVTGILYLAQRVIAKEDAVFHRRHIPLISSAYETIGRAFKIQEKETLAMMFRLGYADSPSARSIRHKPDVR